MPNKFDLANMFKQGGPHFSEDKQQLIMPMGGMIVNGVRKDFEYAIPLQQVKDEVLQHLRDLNEARQRALDKGEIEPGNTFEITIKMVPTGHEFSNDFNYHK